MSAESLLSFIAFLFEAVEESGDSTSFFFFGTAGVGRTADPGCAIVLESPVATKEVSAIRFFVGATDKDNYQQKSNWDNNGGNFGGK